MKSVSLFLSKLPKIVYLTGLALLLSGNLTFGQSTDFTYQGRLNQNGSPYTGTAEIQAALWDSVTGGSLLQTNNLGSLVIGVTNGLFTLPLQFGDAPFSGGADRYLELQVRTALGPFTTLSPRQKLSPSPYAIHASTANVAATATSVPAANVVGTLSLSQLPGATLTNNQSGVNLSGNLTGTFSGNGSNLTNISLNSLSPTATSVSITAWGWDGYGQTDVPGELDNVIAVSAGIGLSLALKSDGSVVEWGNSGTGLLGVPAEATNVMAIAAGYEFNMALKKDGTVLAWGNNDYGQTNVPSGISNVTAIAAGYGQCVALKSDGTVVMWGEPTNLFPTGLNNISAIAAGYYHALALQSNGTIVIWSTDNSVGQTNVPPGLTNVTAIASGAFHSLALKADGTVIAWGDNSAGQTNVPLGLSNVVAIAGLYLGSVALKSDGTVVAWGDNQYSETSVPAGLDNVLALGPCSMAYHVLILRKQVTSPVAWLDSDNTFNGSIRVNGTAEFGTEHVIGESHFGGDATFDGTLLASGELQLESALRMNTASNLYFNFWGDSGLGFYSGSYLKSFAGFSPEGPVLFGGSGGALGTTTGGETIALSWNAQKRVGIGTTSPGAALDVRGDIKLGTNGQYSVPAGEENLRMLRGVIASSGGISGGSGFSVSRTGTGIYAITFATPFTGTPAVTATAADASTPVVATVSSLTASGATINVYAATNGVHGNVAFYFTAIGPR